MKRTLQDCYIEPDVLLVNKPKHWSSFDVIRKLRPILDTRKIGHAGTLDPLATGLMIVGINKGTKKMTQYLKLDKVYVADILLGKTTSTGDLEGEIIEKKSVYAKDHSKNDIEDVLKTMVGVHTLQVPLYSAIKVQGRPLYEYARKGIEPPYIPEKEMTIKKISLLDYYGGNHTVTVRVRVEVTSGSYIRTLGEEFGRRLGYPATLSGLSRVSIGSHIIDGAYNFSTQTHVVPIVQKNIGRDILRFIGRLLRRPAK